MASTVSHCVTSIHCKIQEPMYQDGMPLLGCRCVHPAIRSRAASFLHSQTNTPAKGCEWIMRHSPRYVQPPVSSQLTGVSEAASTARTSAQGNAVRQKVRLLHLLPARWPCRSQPEGPPAPLYCLKQLVARLRGSVGCVCAVSFFLLP